MRTLFVTGIGTDVGKTIISAILTEALQADYWKPVQAGSDPFTDAQRVAAMITNKRTRFHPEVYSLRLPASPHISAREENIIIDLGKIAEVHGKLHTENEWIVVEGAGGLMVPLNEKEFVGDLIKTLDARTVLVSRNYLGSINHSLLTASVTRRMGIDVAGWIFNDHYMDYEEEIANWSGYPKIASIPFCATPDAVFIKQQAEKIRPILTEVL